MTQKNSSQFAVRSSQPYEVEEISPDFLVISEDETRKTLDPVALQQLADSIKLVGIQEPLIVREITAHEFEIVSGQRRHAAARLAGLLTIPCIVRLLSKEDARVARVVSNLQREDVPPLEEADGYEALRQQLGSIEAIAASVSKPVEYVTRRLKLVTLGLHPRDALRERLITIDHALLIAKLGEAEQNAALKYTLDRNAGSKTPIEKVLAERIKLKGQKNANGYHCWHWEPESVVKLKEHIEQSTGRKLSLAPWDLDDASLDVEAGACAVCPSNTKSNNALFGDLDIEDATCANGACFERKREAFVRIRLRTATDDDIPPLRLSFKSTTVKPRWEKDNSGPVRTQVFKEGQWVAAKKKSCEYAEPGIAIDWNESRFGERGKGKPGDLIWVCVSGHCKTHPKGWVKAEKSKASQGSVSHNQNDERVKEKREAFVLSEMPIRRALYEAIKPKVTVSQLLCDLFVDMELDYFDGITDQFLNEVLGLTIPKESSWNWWRDAARKKLHASSEKELLSMLYPFFYLRHVEVNEYDSDIKDHGRTELLALAKRVGVDAAAIIKKFEAPAEKPKPEPVKTPAKKAAKKSAPKAAKK